ncbi:energy transducer TonB [Snuella lapsa]|uniref:Uncharacterized protein n=1 Tax=Snuella lapsa TaxID=870481 RepID=A0ABP6WLU0_9FLAO
MLHYILQTIVFQLFFLLVYDVFLNKETFFNWNRGYLLGTAVLSILLPFIKIQHLKETLPSEYIVTLPPVILGQTTTEVKEPIVLDAVMIAPSMSVWEIMLYVGMAVAFGFFLFKFFRILFFVFKNPKKRFDKALIVRLINSSEAFSFFHYIFLGEQIKEVEKKMILMHEMVHVKQRHTIDLLFFEMLRVLFWFNPLVYMYQNRVAALHEYIADSQAIKYQDKNQYYQNLLSQVFETKHISFINTFFNQSLIKKRIVMLSKSRSKQINLIKYALLIPLVFGMLVYTSAEAQRKGNNSDNQYQELDDESLKEKLYSDLLDMEKAGMSFTEILTASKLNSDRYFVSRVDFYKSQMADKYMLSKGETLVKDLSRQQKMTYADYLEYKKTDEAKLLWESDIKHGVLRLLVNDMDALTDEEQKRKEQKINLIKKDDYLNALRIENIDGSKMYVQSHASLFSVNKRDDSKAVLLNNPSFNVGFDVVDRVPAFPGCEGLSNADLKKCLTEGVSKHIRDNFNYEVADKLNLIGEQRIHVIFKIDEEGNTIDVNVVRALYSELEVEAKRIVKTLPKMIPGQHKGRNVTVPYSLPIIIDIGGNSERAKDLEAIMLNEVEVPFAMVDKAPVFLGCEGLITNEEKRQCMSKAVQKFVNRNFNTAIADSLGLTGRQRINVIFKIDTKGDIVGISSRASHPALEAEAIRVIESLPKIIPGENNGKKVIVPYSLPIIFQVQDQSTVDETVVIAYGENKKKDISEEAIEVPFAVIDQVPVYPGCEDLATNQERKQCMSDKIRELINRKFNTDIAKSLGLEGRQRINVIFKIGENGTISMDDIRARAPHKDLEAEAIRVIKELPKMMPGKQRGKNVTVPYSLPIVFEVDNTQLLDEVAVVAYPSLDQSNIEVPFAVVEEVPVFPGCESLTSNDERKKCMSNEIQSHVNKNFNTKLAKKSGVKGRQNINVIFKIDTNGNITDIRSRAKHPALEAEAIRVIKTLPKMIPGKQRGKNVVVPYSLPIVFQVKR